MVKLGILAFANSGGLGIQSRRLVAMLDPHRILVVDSRHFSENKDLNLDWYKNYHMFKTSQGFPTDKEIDAFLQNLTHVLILENPYNFYIIHKARQLGIKTICQSNYEFCENLEKTYLPVPDIFLMPSYWQLKKMSDTFGHVKYLPPPIHEKEFEVVRETNMQRTGKLRFLHIIGTKAFQDRNGTLNLLEAIKLTKSDFELVIKTQHELPMDYFLDDPRVTYEIGNTESNADLYKNFDALILPRRYGGLSLTTNEALMAGMPVIMTDISPNNEWLPKEWLVPSQFKGQIAVKSVVDVYSVDEQALADKIEWFITHYDRLFKTHAFNLAKSEFSEDVLKPKYLDILK